MKNRFGILSALLVLALLVGNAFFLPKLLTYAQALPEGEVVTQQAAADVQRIPLPQAAEGFGQPFDLTFSRPLSEGEQQLWNALEEEMKADAGLRFAEPAARITYTERAQRRLTDAVLGGEDDPEFAESLLESYPLGNGAPGTILVDLGTVTMNIGDPPLTRKAAIPLMRQVLSTEDYQSPVSSQYGVLYLDSSWMEPQDQGRYTLSRALSTAEWQRYMRLKTAYMLSGLRPSTPLATSKTPDDSLWFEREAATIHLPAAFELTEEEMLHYIELTDTLTRQALLKQTPEMIGREKAIETAGEWAEKLFGMEVRGLSALASLEDGYASAKDGTALWRVQFGPEDMLVRQSNGDYAFEGCEIWLNAADGALEVAAASGMGRAAPTDKTEEELKDVLERTALTTVRALLKDGAEPGEATVQSSGFFTTEQGGGESEAKSFAFIVTMPGGAQHELAFTGEDLVYYRHWPKGASAPERGDIAD